MYLVPAAFVAAELASGWPGEGGVYEWVKDAFGERFGFTAAWIQWFQMTIGFISILAFIAAAIAYIFAPSLASSKSFVHARRAPSRAAAHRRSRQGSRRSRRRHRRP